MSGMAAPGGMAGMGGMPGGMMGAPGAMMPGMGAAPKAAGAGFQVLGLKHARAGELAQTLSQLFPSAQIVADNRTNSLIIKADKDTLKEMQGLIEKLDLATPEPEGGSGSPGGLPPGGYPGASSRN